jgi:hypothetical protein
MGLITSTHKKRKRNILAGSEDEVSSNYFLFSSGFFRLGVPRVKQLHTKQTT